MQVWLIYIYGLDERKLLAMIYKIYLRRKNYFFNGINETLETLFRLKKRRILYPITHIFFWAKMIGDL